MHAGSFAIRLAVIVWAAAVAGPCVGQLKTDPSAWNLPPDGVKRHPDQIVDLHTAPERDSKPIDPYAYRRSLFSSLGLYEYKRMDEVPGQYNKPHYALGVTSELMRNALSLTGLEAERCVAPMVRLRAREATATGANGVSMNVFARCSFY